ncbi:hypothetical protein M153_37310001361 [Pseudoloma neurophilia]|uniref:Uncharacterized protein n=1 Tax=Pseudoloma neurophilia TaxID=146866 RepID=A0A0R0LT84_9MICR|nr:hypothetical protein M153_37310001361 [Pseudoloma neurophilia]
MRLCFTFLGCFKRKIILIEMINGSRNLYQNKMGHFQFIDYIKNDICKGVKHSFDKIKILN